MFLLRSFRWHGDQQNSPAVLNKLYTETQHNNIGTKEAYQKYEITKSTMYDVTNRKCRQNVKLFGAVVDSMRRKTQMNDGISCFEVFK